MRRIRPARPVRWTENRPRPAWNPSAPPRCSKLAFLLVVLLTLVVLPAGAQESADDPSETAATPTFSAAEAARFADLALACVHQEYPNKIAHVLSSDGDVKPPRELTPAFYGCYDWHSSVHGHWLLARLARTYPEAPFAAPARAALAKSLTSENVAAEVEYLEGPGRVSFERPYGLAWLLQLAAELREWDDAPGAEQAAEWSAALAPLEAAAAQRIADWLPKLTYPIRIGEHAQTAFAFGLIRDWAEVAAKDGVAGAGELLRLLDRRSLDYYLADRDCPLEYEPGGQDFLSPCIAEADLMRRLLPPTRYAAWLGAFLPGIPIAVESGDGGTAIGGEGAPTPAGGAPPATAAEWLPVAVVSDPSDPKLAHLDGLNLSRAWMLEGMASGLPADDPRRPALLAAARHHREAGLAAVTGAHYEGGHWLGSFAVYLVTGRGLGAAEGR